MIEMIAEKGKLLKKDQNLIWLQGAKLLKKKVLELSQAYLEVLNLVILSKLSTADVDANKSEDNQSRAYKPPARRDDRGYDRRDDRDRRDERGYDRRDDRGGYDRDRRTDNRGSYDRRNDNRGYERRDDRGGYDRRNDRGSTSSD